MKNQHGAPHMQQWQRDEIENARKMSKRKLTETDWTEALVLGVMSAGLIAGGLFAIFGLGL